MNLGPYISTTISIIQQTNFDSWYKAKMLSMKRNHKTNKSRLTKALELEKSFEPIKNISVENSFQINDHLNRWDKIALAYV